MLEDAREGEGWRRDWRALPRKRRATLLAELRRAEILRPPHEAHLAVREARRLLRRLPVQAAAIVLAPVLFVVIGRALLGPIPLIASVSEAIAAAPASFWVGLAVIVGVRHRRLHRNLQQGIRRNLEGLRHWVEHGQAAGLGPPTGREALLLLRLIEEEGWTRPHR
jgi:hypothetical protein